MDINQVALKLVLDGIGEDSSIASVDDRLRLQKAIYLSQAAGINLGYHYSWYVKGPYSPGLTQDYYKLSEALAADDKTHEGMVLNASLMGNLARVRQILNTPEGVNTSKPSWYEALASIHFLIATSGYTVDKSREHLKMVKPHLNQVFDAALQHLRNVGLVTA